jgi:uncharacterized protein YkwD
MTTQIDPTPLEVYFLELVNADRAQVGAPPLSFDWELVMAAGDHSAWMDAQDVFSHTGINGSSPGDRITAAGYWWSAYGENVAYIAGSVAAALDQADVWQLHTNLMNSPGHRENLLNPIYRDAGIGLVQGTYRGMPAIFVTEDFGRPTAAEAAEMDRWFV